MHWIQFYISLWDGVRKGNLGISMNIVCKLCLSYWTWPFTHVWTYSWTSSQAISQLLGTRGYWDQEWGCCSSDLRSEVSDLVDAKVSNFKGWSVTALDFSGASLEERAFFRSAVLSMEALLLYAFGHEFCAMCAAILCPLLKQSNQNSWLFNQIIPALHWTHFLKALFELFLIEKTQPPTDKVKG